MSFTHEELPIGSTYGIFTIVGKRTKLPRPSRSSNGSYVYPCVCNVCGSKVYRTYFNLVSHPVSRCKCSGRSPEKIIEIKKAGQRLYNGLIEVCPGYYANPYMINKKYGLSLNDYKQILIGQDFKCAICGKTFEPFSKGKVTSPHVDHDHDTGNVRGLLCYSCNLGLGNFQDRIPNFKSAIKYLGKYEKRT